VRRRSQAALCCFVVTLLLMFAPPCHTSKIKTLNL
jgi:hypothetical protein